VLAAAALAPEGSAVVFVLQGDGDTEHLGVRDLDRLAAIDFGDQGRTLSVADLTTGTRSRLIRGERNPLRVAWTPDDSAVVVHILDSGKRAVVAFDPRNESEHGLFPATDRLVLPASVAPDGTLLCDELISGRLNDIVSILRGGRETRPTLRPRPTNEERESPPTAGSWRARATRRAGARSTRTAFPSIASCPG